MTKKVSIFGLGKSGISAAKAAVKLGYQVFVINEGIKTSWTSFNEVSSFLPASQMIEQNDSLEVFASSDLIILSPGIPYTHEVLKKAVANKVEILSEIEFGLQFCSAPIIAITGTNGKTTTTTMIGEMLKANHISTFVCGNIGIPVCDLAMMTEKIDVIVMEVSSFQLETIKDFHPHIALILNITPNHGERYNGLLDYAQAKFNIVKNMNESDHLIYHADEAWLKDWAQKQKVQKHPYCYSDVKKLLQKDFDLSLFPLVGVHNLYNLYNASIAVTLLGKKLGKDFKAGIQKTINVFKGVPHRIEFVGEFSSGKVYNDAKSTNILATLTAIRSFEGQGDLYLMLGGKKRGNNDSLKEFIPELKKYVKKILLVGETTPMLYEELKNELEVYAVETFENALDFFKKENSGGTLLLSPAYPSFDQFKNYGHRGESFKAWALERLT
ncbi:MAG: UDP-N-acetylmuramoyl-L-alanine--D-glutamate ligase [Bacteriovoracaceae bacterium]